MKSEARTVVAKSVRTLQDVVIRLIGPWRGLFPNPSSPPGSKVDTCVPAICGMVWHANEQAVRTVRFTPAHMCDMYMRIPLIVPPRE